MNSDSSRDCGACGRPGTVGSSADGSGACHACGAGGTPIVRRALHLAGADYRERERWDAVAKACRHVGLRVPAGPKPQDQVDANFTIPEIGARFGAVLQSAEVLRDCPLCPRGPLQVTSPTTWKCDACGIRGSAMALAALFAFGSDYADPDDNVGLAYLREKGRLANL